MGRILTVAVPEEEEAATTERLMTSPALIGIPVKSVEARGNHSNHASKETAPLAACRITELVVFFFCFLRTYLDNRMIHNLPH